MTDAERKEDMLNYFNERIFEPAIKFSKESGIREIAQGCRYTKMRMSQLEPVSMLGYFWSAIQGTDKSIRFADLLKQHGVLRFEDILEDVRVRFNDEYFRN